MTRFLSPVVVALAMANPAMADPWPGLLGLDRDSTSNETGLLKKWPTGGPKQLWRIDMGPGFGGAAIRDGQVFVLDRIDEDGDALRVLDVKTGRELWRYEYEAVGRLAHEGSRSTPTVTADHVLTVGGFGDLYCIDRKTHQPLWSLNLGKQYEAGDLNWGYAQSPLIYKDWLIVSPTHQETPGLVALDQRTGKVVWEAEKFGGDYYSSPVLRAICGKQGVLMIAQKLVIFVDPDTGRTIWKYDGYDVKYPIPSPTVLPDGEHLFVTGGYGAGSVMIRVTEAGGRHEVREVWRITQGSQLHPAIFLNERLFANINENDNLRGPRRSEGGLACLDPKTGRIIWRTGENPSMDRGHFFFVDGVFIALEGETGELYLIEPSTRGFEAISSFTALPPKRRSQNKVWAPMALSDGLLVVRDQQEMRCFDLRGRRTASVR